LAFREAFLLFDRFDAVAAEVGFVY